MGVSAWWWWIPLGVFFLSVNVAGAILAIDDAAFPGEAEYALRFVSLFLFWQWLEAECRPYQQTYPLDMGMFLYVAAFVIIPYYLWRHQRWHGLFKVVGMVALWLGTYLIAEGGAFALRTLIAE